MAISFIASTTVNIGTAASTWSINSSNVNSVATDNGWVLGLTHNSSAVTVTAVTDDLGNAWSVAQQSAVTGSSARAAIWYTRKYAASTRVSVTMSGSCSGTISLASVGRLGFPQVNGSTIQTGNSTSHNVASLTPASSGIFFHLARCLFSTIGTNVTPSGWTIWASSAAQIRNIGFYQIQATADSTNCAWTTSSNTGQASVLVGFAEWSSLASGSPTLPMLGCQ